MVLYMVCVVSGPTSRSWTRRRSMSILSRTTPSICSIPGITYYDEFSLFLVDICLLGDSLVENSIGGGEWR